jgi:hypothetical protein
LLCFFVQTSFHLEQLKFYCYFFPIQIYVTLLDNNFLHLRGRSCVTLCFFSKYCVNFCALVKLFVCVLIRVLAYFRISTFLRISKSNFVNGTPVEGLMDRYGLTVRLLYRTGGILNNWNRFFWSSELIYAGLVHILFDIITYVYNLFKETIKPRCGNRSNL